MDRPGLPTTEMLEAADVAAEGFGELGEPLTDRMAYVLPAPLKERINGVLRWAGDTRSLPGITSQIALVRIATHRYLNDLERDHNDGQPFAVPANNNRGRGPTNAQASARISVVWPLSLHRRLLGAAAWAAQTGQLPGVTSANKLVVAALDRYLTDIEQTHHKGKPFRDPRAKLPAGRPPSR